MIIRHTRFPAVNIFTDSITALILRPNTSTFLMMEILNTDYSADASFQIAKTKMQRQLGEWSRAYRFSFLFSKFSTKSVVREAAVIFTFYPFDHKFQFRIFLLTVRKGGFFYVPVAAASSCVAGAPSTGLTVGSWKGLLLDASQPEGDLRLPARWLWCRETTHRSGHHRSSRTAVHRLWPGNNSQGPF